MPGKERIAEARRDKAGRKSEQAKKQKKALARNRVGWRLKYELNAASAIY